MINLFWTGGFDSTYRLLEILLLEGKSVQTHYIVDTGRPSAITEIKAMESIKDALLERNPAIESLLQPVKLDLKSNIRPNPEITGQYNRVAAQASIGIQYEWLARYAAENHLSDLEVGFIKHEPEHVTDLDNLMHPELVGHGHDCRIREDVQKDELKLFQYFRFPTIHLTKAEVMRLAKQRGFNDLLSLTWYCHTPTPEGLPCGYCTPCTVRKGSGLPHLEARRPLKRRVVGRMKRILAGARVLSR